MLVEGLAAWGTTFKCWSHEAIVGGSGGIPHPQKYFLYFQAKLLILVHSKFKIYLISNVQNVMNKFSTRKFVVSRRISPSRQVKFSVRPFVQACSMKESELVVKQRVFVLVYYTYLNTFLEDKTMLLITITWVFSEQTYGIFSSFRLKYTNTGASWMHCILLKKK